MDFKTDLLVFAAHPDDAELACAGTVISEIEKGKKVVFADLTQGEMGTRGTPETRREEAAGSATLLKLSARVQLGLPDTEFGTSREFQIPLIQTIRRFRPDIVLCNAIDDRHPDHGRSAQLEKDACFFSGLSKIETIWEGEKQAPWRPRLVLHYIQDRWIKPDFVLDITPYWKTKMASIQAYKTQFYDPTSDEPETYISSSRFINFLEGRAREFGHIIDVEFGEGFTCARPPGIKDLGALL